MWKRYFAFVMAMMLMFHTVPMTVYAEEGVDSVHSGTEAVEVEEKSEGEKEDSYLEKKEQPEEGQNAESESEQSGQEQSGKNAEREQPGADAGQEQIGENTEAEPKLLGEEEMGQPGNDIGQGEQDEESEEIEVTDEPGSGKAEEEQPDTESEPLPAVNATGDTGEYQPEGANYKLRYTEVTGGVKIVSITGTKTGELRIPEKIGGLNVVEIGERAFSDCSGLTGELTIPSCVRVIGEKAFLGCRNLTDIIIPESVEKIESNAFAVVTWGTESEYFLQPIKITVYSKDVEIAQNAFGMQKILYGYSGSSVEQYAAMNNCAFGLIDEPSQISEYRVTNATELINAIGSYRRIILADGVYEIVEENYSGGITLSGIVSLSIEAENLGKAEILCKPGKDNNGNNGTECFDPVITVATCEDIKINGLILGHDGEFGGCNPEAYVVGVSNASNIMINNCDLYGCGSIGVNCRAVNGVNISNSVVRDCQLHIASGSSNSYNGADIKSFCFNECIMSGHIGHTHADYYYSALNCPNELYLTDCVLLNNNNPTFDDHSAVLTNCKFYNNVWDGGTPQPSGICLNGITWQVDGTVLKLGFSLELDKGTIESKKGKVMDYSVSAAPWKNCEFTEVQYAEGIEEPDKDIIGGGSGSTNPVESIKLDKNILALSIGETVMLTAEITPESVNGTSVTWSSNDTSVATVQNGLVTAVSTGECTITASAGGKSAACYVTVVKDQTSDDIASGKYDNLTWKIDVNGNLTVNGEHEFAPIVISDYYDTKHFTRAPWYEYRDRIISAEINVRYMNDASYMFYGCTNLTSVDLRHFDTSRLGSMYGMFMGCKSLNTLDLSNLDTGQVHHMGSMFSGCNRLTDLKLGNLDTSQVTDMNSMFDSCSSLTSLDLSSFDVSNVSTMDSMFWECSALTDLNLSNFNTSNQLMYIADMFSGCSSLVELDLSSFDGSGVRDLLSFFGDDNTFSMFEGCNSLATIYTPYNLQRYYQLPGGSGENWYQPDGSQITKLPTGCDSMKITKNRVPDVYDPYIKATIRKTEYVCGDFIATRGLTVKYYGSDGTIKKVTDYITNEDEIDMSTPGKKTLVITYNGLSAEIELNVSVAWVERIVLNEDSLTLSKGEMSILYADVFPKSALSLPVTWASSDPSIAKVIGSGHDGYVTAVSGGECIITVSAGDQSTSCIVRVTDNQTEQPADDIANGSYGDVKWRIDVNGKLIVEGSDEFADSGSTDRVPWYQYRSFIKSAEINLTGTTNTSYLFYGCQNLTDADVSKFDMSNVTDIAGMFQDCSSLTSINLSNCDMKKVISITDFFKGCQKLSVIYVPCNLKMLIELPRGNSTISGNNIAPEDIWYDIDGNTYTELPQNLSHSIVLTRNQKPVISEPHITLEKGKTSYIIGEKLNTDDLKVTYYNETGIPSRVNDYTTNADEIDMSMPGKKTLVVTYRDLRAEIEITVNEKQTEETQGLKISFKNEQDRESTYTGSAIKPEIRVTYNGRLLIAGTNYTVKYANNVKVGNAKITVTGKGNFRSSKTETFRIVQADIANADFAGTDQTDRLVVASGAKFVPLIYCGGRKLTANDYTISGTVRAGKKITESDFNQIVTLSGKGNYTGNKKITLRVVKKSDLIKFTVTLDKTKLNSLFYDGKAHYIHEISGALTVTGRDGNANMKYGTDYMIAYPANVTDADAKKFSVIGMGIYTGTVNKSYTIKPAANTEGALKVEYESGNIENIKLPYRSTGVTFNDRLQVTYTKNGNTLTLREGRDYKITYSSNKKAGSNAKFMISFLGNYKGIKKWAGTFTIEKADLEDATVIIPDAMYKKKPGIYKSVPYVIEPETGRLIKASSYTVTYYTDQTRNMEMKGKNKVSSGDTVYVKLEAKANSNYKSDKPIVKTYQVTSAVDLSKAKLSFMSAETRTATKSAEYTGQKITDREITVLVNGKPADADMIVTYANNVDKGKATVIVTGTGKPGCKYTGCKKATFNIVAYSLR